MFSNLNREKDNKSLFFSSHLQRLSTWVLLAVVDCQQVADDRWVHSGVNGALALGVIALPVQSQAIGVKACPLSGAQVYLQSDHAGATVYHQIIVI